MNQPETSATSRIGQWASRQLADYDAHHPGTLFAEGLVLNVAEGYELQSAVAELRQRRGERIIGYKVGCCRASRPWIIFPELIFPRVWRACFP